MWWRTELKIFLELKAYLLKDLGNSYGAAKKQATPILHTWLLHPFRSIVQIIRYFIIFLLFCLDNYFCYYLHLLMIVCAHIFILLRSFMFHNLVTKQNTFFCLNVLKTIILLFLTYVSFLKFKVDIRSSRLQGLHLVHIYDIHVNYKAKSGSKYAWLSWITFDHKWLATNVFSVLQITFYRSFCHKINISLMIELKLHYLDLHAATLKWKQPKTWESVSIDTGEKGSYNKMLIV